MVSTPPQALYRLSEPDVEPSRDLAEPAGVDGSVDAGDDVLARDDVPGHVPGQVVAAVDEGVELLGGSWQAGHEFGGDALGFDVLDLVAVLLAEGHELLGAEVAAREVG